MKITPRDRAKLILDLCAYELKDMAIWSQAMLEASIEAQIKVAVDEALKEVGLHPKHELPVITKQTELRRRAKRSK